jgi:hypothetical protein
LPEDADLHIGIADWVFGSVHDFRDNPARRNIVIRFRRRMRWSLTAQDGVKRILGRNVRRSPSALERPRRAQLGRFFDESRWSNWGMACGQPAFLRTAEEGNRPHSDE